MPGLPDIQAVTFDVGGTLIEPWPSVGHIYAEVTAQHGWKNFSPDTLNRQFAAAWRTKRNFDHSRAAWRELVEQTFARLKDVPVSDALFDALYKRFAQPDTWRVFNDVHPALDQLRNRGLTLGVVSNWDARLRPLLGRLALSQYFDAIVISIEVGYTKPAAEIFRLAASVLKLPCRAILHVGDSAEEDLGGAQAAGFEAALLDRKARRAAGQTIGSLTALARLLKKPGWKPLN